MWGRKVYNKGQDMLKIMRRNDKEITDKEALFAIIDQSPYVTMAFSGAAPYAVPLDFSRLADHIYVHCAKEGRKIDLIRENNLVFLLFVNYDGIFCHTTGVACGLSTKFTSVMASGEAFLVEDLTEKAQAFAAMLVKHKSEPLPIPPKALDKTFMFKVKILDMSGKQNPAPVKA